MAASTEPIDHRQRESKDEIEANFGRLYEQVPSRTGERNFELRPGVNLLLYVSGVARLRRRLTHQVNVNKSSVTQLNFASHFIKDAKFKFWLTF